MQKIICKKLYDTEKSEIVKKVTFGSFGEADGYEETLYVTEDGSYFLYENGGESSIHPKENIKRMSKKSADEWLKNN
ncbi:MAG: hypothetical protein E7596_08475 [Ruminococcaceae bacterium]|nr:hypothetical protein [Oscillospiraceae bacterium]